jgi:DNA-binding response OmpR family regulator
VGWNLKTAPVVRTARILVVEDNISDVILLDRALKKQEFAFQLMHLLSGDAALAFIRGEGGHAGAPIPDMVLIDLNLSKYSGEDILREFRRAVRFDAVPVCVWSSSRSRRDETRLKGLGVSQFIAKPAGLDQFMAIGKLLKDLFEADPVDRK